MQGKEGGVVSKRSKWWSKWLWMDCLAGAKVRKFVSPGGFGSPKFRQSKEFGWLRKWRVKGKRGKRGFFLKYSL